MINLCYDKANEETAFRMWLSIYPFMDKRSFISFADYKAQMVRPRVTEMVDTQQILRDVAVIRDQLRKEGLHGDL